MKGLISWVMAGHELKSEACVSIHGKRRAAPWPTLLSLASDLRYLGDQPDLVNTLCELTVHSCTKWQSAECHVTLGRSRWATRCRRKSTRRLHFVQKERFIVSEMHFINFCVRLALFTAPSATLLSRHSENTLKMSSTSTISVDRLSTDLNSRH